MLDSLSTRLQSIFDRLGGRGRLTEENIQEALREVRVALLEADTNRPAAQDQLQTLGGELGVPVVGGPGQTPLAICRQARQDAAARGLTPLILDTAGRLHIDEPLLEELAAIRKDVLPHHVLLVV